MAVSRLQLASRIQFLLQRKMHMHVDVTEMLLNADYAGRMLTLCRETGTPEAETLAAGFESLGGQARRVPGLPVPQAPSIPVQPSVLRRPILHVRGAEVLPRAAAPRPALHIVRADPSPSTQAAPVEAVPVATEVAAVAAVLAAREARESREARSSAGAKEGWWVFPQPGLAGA